MELFSLTSFTLTYDNADDPAEKKICTGFTDYIGNCIGFNRNCNVPVGFY